MSSLKIRQSKERTDWETRRQQNLQSSPYLRRLRKRMDKERKEAIQKICITPSSHR